MLSPSRDYREHGVLENEGRAAAIQVVITDARLDEVVRDKAELREYAKRRFDIWWRKKLVELEAKGEQKRVEEYNNLDDDEKNDMQRLFIGAFIQTYQKKAEEFDKRGHPPEPFSPATLTSGMLPLDTRRPTLSPPISLPLVSPPISLPLVSPPRPILDYPPTPNVTQEVTSHGPSVEIVDTHHSDDSRVYEVELTDPDFLDDPVRVEIVVDDEGGAELREVIDDD